jgi:hypothetical protein
VHLDQRGHPQGLGALTQADQRGLVEGRHDEQDDVRAPGARLPHLVAGDHEVLAQHRDVDRGAHGGQVLEAAAEAALLGEDADHAGATGRVVRREPGRVGDHRERTLARAGALDLGDHLDATAAAERGQGVMSGVAPLDPGLQLLQRGA